jgi:ribulose-phosphate 3-epimerase
MQLQIAPSILAADFLNLEKDIRILNEAADIIHLDVMDGTLVPNISFGFSVVEPIAKIAEKPLDAHLMIIHPEKYFERFAACGIDMLSFHLEAAEQERSDPSALLARVRSLGMKAGLAFNPDMPLERVIPFIENTDYLVLMSVYAGFGGQSFIEESHARLAALKREIAVRNPSCQIEVDGGVTPSNAASIHASGADILVAGSAVFKSGDPRRIIAALRGTYGG